MKASRLVKELFNSGDEKQARILSGFFKTGKGQYGEGDIFLGIRVPVIREISSKYVEMDIDEIQKLLNSKFHEVRFAGLVILVKKFEKSITNEKEIIVNFYLKNISHNINNWDLVDLSCPQIIGRYIFEKKENSILLKLAQSSNLWERRVAIVSNLYAIRKSDFNNTLLIAEILLYDTHDLINKAVGWMLREVGKKDIETEKEFLKKYFKDMPRVSLRYAIERMDNKEKIYFMNKENN
ncbi:DNA alkylation repair protein [bacterium]|nr:DNA alkylation repair protein [bacterium]